MRHGPGSPPPCSARDSGGGWEKAGSGRCSDGEAWAWPPSGAAPPKCWAFQALAGSVYPLWVSPTLPALVSGLGGNRCAHHRGQKSLAPSAPANPPLLPPFLSSDSCQCLPLPCISCSRQGQPPGHAHPPLRIPCPSGPFALPPLGTRYPFGLLHILHSVSLAALMHCPVGIPWLPGPLHTLRSEFRVPRGFQHNLHSKLQAPDTGWAPYSIQEAV